MDGVGGASGGGRFLPVSERKKRKFTQYEKDL